MSIQPTATAPRLQGAKKPFRLASIRDPQPRPLIQEPPAKKRKIERIQRCTVPTCQSRDIEEDNGHLVCQSCGTVLQEMNIVSDNMFIDGPGGEAMRAGVTVGNDAARPRNFDAVAARIVGGMSSREVSEANGRQAIRAVSGHPLNIVQDLQDTAMQVYKLCLANNFVQGRLTRSVAAVCLYIACRRSNENNKFMLIDFADKCNINVFKLGTVFKDLLQVLHLNSSAFNSLEPINIESLILRFAEQMNFGRMKQRIANEAVRIVQRMSRDWMTDGRRPAGICGAALILAARMNNFRRVVREVVYTVKVAEQTILNRLHEFSQTASSNLTVEEFRTTDLEKEEDPPAFKNRDKVKKKRGRPRKVRAGDADDDNASQGSTSRAASAVPQDANDQLQTPANTQAERDRQNMPPPPVPIDPALLQVSKQRLAELQALPGSTDPSSSTPQKRGRGRPPGKTAPLPEPTNQDLQIEAQLEADIQSLLDNETNIENARAIHENPDAPGNLAANLRVSVPPTPPPTQPSAAATQSVSTSTPTQTEADPNPSEEQPQQPPTQPRSLTNPQQPLSRSPSLSPSPQPTTHHPAHIKPSQLITAQSTTHALLSLIPSTPIIPDAEFAADPEITACLLTPSEIAIKERIWVHENSAYLRAQQNKFLRQQLAERNGTARVVVRRKRRRTRMGDLSGIYGEEGDGEGGEGGEGGGKGIGKPKDAAEAVERMMRKRGFSRKINYGVIGSAYSSESSSRRSSVAAPGVPETGLSPAGEIIVVGEGSREGSDVRDVGGARGQAGVGAKEKDGVGGGGSREEAIEIEEGEEEEMEDDYYDEDEMDMEMAGVDEVLGRIEGSDDEEQVEEEEG